MSLRKTFGFVSNIEVNGFTWRIFGFNLFVSLVYVLILLFYTHGSLLFDGDNFGFYHLDQTGLLSSPSGLLEMFSLLLSFGNYYLAFYLYTFISLVFATSAIFYLARLFVSIVYGEENTVFVLLLTPFLYVVVPYILVDYYSTLLANVSISSSFFTLFLAFWLKFYKNRDSHFSESRKNAILSGVFLGLSVTPFPNVFRIIVIGGVLFITIFLVVFIQSILQANWRKSLLHLVNLLLFIAFLIFASLFMTYQILLNFSLISTLASTAANNFINLNFYTGGFNSIPWTIRLLGSWSFPTSFVIYHSMYFGINFIALASFSWPFLALFIPIIALYHWKNVKDPNLLTIILILTIAGIFWEKAANPPFGEIWYFINSHLPFGYEFIPTGTITFLLLTKFYTILSIFSLIFVYKYLSQIRIQSVKRLRKFISISIPIFLASMLLVAELPVFDGQLEANYFNPKSSGFIIPNDYNLARELLRNYSGTTLILPGVQTYITTNWNYSGSSSFYNAFFSPFKVITVQDFGGGYSSQSNISDYVNMTSPINEYNSTWQVNLQWVKQMNHDGVTYLLVDYSLLSGSHYETYNYTDTAIDLLEKSDLISLVFTGSNLNLYRLNGLA